MPTGNDLRKHGAAAESMAPEVKLGALIAATSVPVYVSLNAQQYEPLPAVVENRAPGRLGVYVCSLTYPSAVADREVARARAPPQGLRRRTPVRRHSAPSRAARREAVRRRVPVVAQLERSWKRSVTSFVYH